MTQSTDMQRAKRIYRVSWRYKFIGVMSLNPDGYTYRESLYIPFWFCKLPEQH